MCAQIQGNMTKYYLRHLIYGAMKMIQNCALTLQNEYLPLVKTLQLLFFPSLIFHKAFGLLLSSVQRYLKNIVLHAIQTNEIILHLNNQSSKSMKQHTILNIENYITVALSNQIQISNVQQI